MVGKMQYYPNSIVILAHGKPCDQISSIITAVYLGSFHTNYNNICRNLETFQKF
jgi:hypothetical protein